MPARSVAATGAYQRHGDVGSPPRRRRGRRQRQGAFAETKEVIGGYYLIDALDLETALRIAGQVPAPFGGVEVGLVRAVG